MFAWMLKSADRFSALRQIQPVAAGVLYRLTVVFPSWAGGVLAVYSIFLCRFSTLRIRQK
jgi:hypothetical protein